MTDPTRRPADEGGERLSSGDGPFRDGRGREARSPARIPRRGWIDVLWRVRCEILEDKVGVLAASCAFYLLLATVPMLAAIASLYGLVSSPQEVWDQFQYLRGVLPEEAFELLRGEMLTLSVQPGGAGLGLFIGLALSLWGGAKGMDALMGALNVVYDERESRPWFRRKAMALTLTLVGVLFAVVTVALVLVLPALAALLPSRFASSSVWMWMRWPALYVLALVWFAVLYRYAPNRASPRWQWVTPGALGGALVWILGSVVFAAATSHFGSARTYGSLAAVVMLLLWYHLTVWVVLVGGEVNAEAEHQTARDSTTGPERPMGRRGAHVADTLGDLRPSDRGLPPCD